MIGKTIKIEIYNRSIEGVILDIITIAREYKITVPSGQGGIIRNECTQQVSCTAYLIKDSEGKIRRVYPEEISAIT